MTPTEELLLRCDRECLEELHDLLDLIQDDGSMHDLDAQEPQTTLGQTLLELMRENEHFALRLKACEERNLRLRRKNAKLRHCGVCGGKFLKLSGTEHECDCA